MSRTKQEQPTRAVGRPRTDKGQRQGRTTITWHTDEANLINTAAKKVGKKPTAFVRSAALEAAAKISPPTNDD